MVQKIKLERNKVSLSIQGQIVEALIDTGATYSVISESLLNHLKFFKREEIQNDDIDCCTLANGE